MLKYVYMFYSIGANITIMARDLKKLDSAKKILLPLVVEGKQKIVCVSCDCSSNLASVESSLKTSVTELGDVDILVNCAGSMVVYCSQLNCYNNYDC